MSKHFESLYPPETREDEIEKLIPFIQKGVSSQLIGLPGSGKNTIFGLLSYNKEVRQKHFGKYDKNIHFVYTDCSEIAGRPLTELVKFMLISLSFSLNERGLASESKTIDDFLKEALSFNEELVLLTALKKSIDFIANEKKRSIIFLFDRFDQYIPTLKKEFFSQLKVLRNIAKYRFSAIFALNRPLEESIDSFQLSDYYDFIIGNNVFVNIYDPIGIKFRLSYIEKTTREKRDESVKNKIVMLTGGHGKLTRTAYESVLSEKENIKNVKDYLLKKPAVRGVLLEIWQVLLPSEQLILKHLNNSKRDEENAPHLSNIGLLEKDKISIPLLEYYIDSLPVTNVDKLTLNEKKNEIFKGETSLSRILSPSEQRLLTYLIENEGKICSKDEIIMSVWKDSATQEGVTDQALDQIFYRLRKKIELDPKYPQLIQTLKGRGYRLLQ